MFGVSQHQDGVKERCKYKVCGEILDEWKPHYSPQGAGELVGDLKGFGEGRRAVGKPMLERGGRGSIPLQRRENCGLGFAK